MIDQFHENFAWLCANTCDIVCEEDLKHFHTSLLGNEEDANGLLNIKQEFLSHYLTAPYSGKNVASGFTWKEEVW